MSLSLTFGCLWVLAATATALLPLRLQRYPGLPLLILAPVLLGWIAHDHGLIWLAFGLFAFASMFRRPLEYLARKALGLPTWLPPELQQLQERRK